MKCHFWSHFQETCHSHKADEVIKKPFFKTTRSPSLSHLCHLLHISRKYTLLSSTLNHGASRESHLWWDLFLGKHWQAPCCLTPTMCTHLLVLNRWGLLTRFLVHCHIWESQKIGTESRSVSTTCNTHFWALSPWLVTSLSLGLLILGKKHAPRNHI